MKGPEIVHVGDMEWGPSLVAHRQGSMKHKRIFDGEEGSADNYSLSLAAECSDYYSPTHRHLWDQVRFCLGGSVPIGRTMSVHAGDVGYFPEGVRYGPQQGGPDRLVLVLQFGGVSGNGFMSAEQTARGRAELSAVGRFEGGFYHYAEGADRSRQDAYEAIWEHILDVRVDYPEPAYGAPIVLRPEGFPWHDVAGAAHVRRRALGVIAPRNVGLDMFALDSGAELHAGTCDALRLVFVHHGTGACDGESFGEHAAIRLAQGANATICATTALEMLVITLSSVQPQVRGDAVPSPRPAR